MEVIELWIKGDMNDAENALRLHGILDWKYIGRTPRREYTSFSVYTTEIFYLDEVARWFCDGLSASFPPGSLLYYQIRRM